MSLDSPNPSADHGRAGEAGGIAFSDRREILEANLARQIEAIRASDSKISLLVPTTTAMIGILAALLSLAPLSSNASLYVAISTVPLIAAYAMMATAIIPRIRGGRSPRCCSSAASRSGRPRRPATRSSASTPRATSPTSPASAAKRPASPGPSTAMSATPTSLWRCPSGRWRSSS